MRGKRGSWHGEGLRRTQPAPLENDSDGQRFADSQASRRTTKMEKNQHALDTGGARC